MEKEIVKLFDLLEETGRWKQFRESLQEECLGELRNADSPSTAFEVAVKLRVTESVLTHIEESMKRNTGDEDLA